MVKDGPGRPGTPSTSAGEVSEPVTVDGARRHGRQRPGALRLHPPDRRLHDRPAHRPRRNRTHPHRHQLPHRSGNPRLPVTRAAHRRQVTRREVLAPAGVRELDRPCGEGVRSVESVETTGERSLRCPAGQPKRRSHHAGPPVIHSRAAREQTSRHSEPPRGPRHHPLEVATRVRTPLGLPLPGPRPSAGVPRVRRAPAVRRRRSAWTARPGGWPIRPR